jgi:hypothetical protein
MEDFFKLKFDEGGKGFLCLYLSPYGIVMFMMDA